MYPKCNLETKRWKGRDIYWLPEEPLEFNMLYLMPKSGFSLSSSFCRIFISCDEVTLVYKKIRMIKKKKIYTFNKGNVYPNRQNIYHTAYAITEMTNSNAN